MPYGSSYHVCLKVMFIHHCVCSIQVWFHYTLTVCGNILGEVLIMSRHGETGARFVGHILVKWDLTI